ncbi:hypothetical protein Pcinc_036236 [Petrolisthes cinctipes]|uniref:Uncharacterized protein n=1 Tax=Petrolisthes cinctipes TaxID=88211 RepID=A0AAE1EMJ4_PETCI|nr:hypothetical protein Pcinc_036236 [Petrolisthes cinctipes]
MHEVSEENRCAGSCNRIHPRQSKNQLTQVISQTGMLASSRLLLLLLEDSKVLTTRVKEIREESEYHVTRIGVRGVRQSLRIHPCQSVSQKLPITTQTQHTDS